MKVFKFFFLLSFSIFSTPSKAEVLIASDGADNDSFGSISLSGNMAVVGAYANSGNFSFQGFAYLYNSIVFNDATISENATLYASDAQPSSFFGYSTALSGDMAVIGAFNHNSVDGSAYLFRNLDTASGFVHETAKLAPSISSNLTSARFGWNTSMHGTSAVVTAYSFTPPGNFTQNNERGAAFYYKNLDLITSNSTVTEDVFLLASDGGNSDWFGQSSGLFNNTAIIGASKHNSSEGAAYIFRNLDTLSGNVTEDLKLKSSSPNTNDLFGYSVSISGNVALVGAIGADIIGNNTNDGAAFLFRNIDTLSGVATQNLRLLASDASPNDNFGRQLKIVGNTALVGVENKQINGNANQGAAYLYTNLDQANSDIYETIKFYNLNGSSEDRFGYSVSLTSNSFGIGESRGTGLTPNSGKAFVAAIRTFTEADLGNDITHTSGLSFVSRTDWIIGNSTANNTVVLSQNSSANVTSPGKKVIIGENSGNNLLSISLNALLKANEVLVGLSLTANNEIKVDGILETANLTISTSSILSGSGLIIGSNGTFNVGSVRPGGSGIGSLKIQNSSLAWDSSIMPSPLPWKFQLGSASSSIPDAFTSNSSQDWVQIINGSFLKGTFGLSRTFDFDNTGSAGFYKLVDWDLSTDFTQSDFGVINLPSGVSLVDFIIDPVTSALYVQLIPEPTTLTLILTTFGFGLLVLRKKFKNLF